MERPLSIHDAEGLRQILLSPGKPEEEERVAPADACPECGEDRMDWLVWVTYSAVRCNMCGAVYCPG